MRAPLGKTAGKGLGCYVRAGRGRRFRSAVLNAATGSDIAGGNDGEKAAVMAPPMTARSARHGQAAAKRAEPSTAADSTASHAAAVTRPAVIPSRVENCMRTDGWPDETLSSAEVPPRSLSEGSILHFRHEPIGVGRPEMFSAGLPAFPAK